MIPAFAIFVLGSLFTLGVASMVRQELGRGASLVSAVIVFFMVAVTAVKVLVIGGG